MCQLGEGDDEVILGQQAGLHHRLEVKNVHQLKVSCLQAVVNAFQSHTVQQLSGVHHTSNGSSCLHVAMRRDTPQCLQCGQLEIKEVWVLDQLKDV